MGKRNWNVIFLILFLLITPSAISAPYNLPGCLFKLSGGESPDDPILVDDDLEITLYDSAGNFKGDLVLDHDSRGSSFSEQFSAVSGDKIKISAWDANPCKRMLSPIFIHYPDGGKVKLTEGVPDQEVSEQYIASNPSAGGCNKASTLPRYDPDYKEEDVVYYRYGKDETKKVMQEKFFGPLEFTVDFVCPCKRIEPADDGANGLDVGYSEGETGLSPNSFFGASDYCSDGKSTIPGSQYPADTKSGFFVVQGKCEGNQVQFDAIQCPQGSTCYSGRCSRDCIDTDPPWSPQRPNGKGTTSGIAVDGKTEVSHEDYCTTWVDRSGYLKEDLSILPEAQFKKMAEGGKYREIKYLIINSRGIGLLPNAVMEGTCRKNPKAKDPNAEYVTLTRSFCNNQPCINGECVNGASLGGKPFLRPMGYRNFLDRYARSGKTITVPEREIAANEFEPLECGINGDRLFDNLKADFTLYSVREGGELESQNCLPNGCGDLTSGPLKEKIAERKGITCNMFGCSSAFLPSDSLRVDVGPSTMVTGKKWKPGERLMCEISVGGVPFYSMPLPIRGNVKNEIYYSKDSVFVISDEKWQDVLKFVPVSIWEDGSGKDYSWCNHPKVSDGAEVREKCAYPYLIFHKESDFVDTRSVAYFINKQYIDQSSGQVASVNFLGQMPKTHGILGKEFKIFSPDDYFNPNYFWRDFSTVVIASDKSEDYGEGLLASQLSSYLNAPLIFLSKDSLDKYSGIFRIPWKKLSLVVMPGVDWELTEKLRSEYGHFVLSLVTGGLLYDPNAAGSTFKDTSQVQRLIQTFKKTNKVIITNPKDMSPAYCEQDLKIDPFPPFKEWYCKMSLAAPILASSRDWLIAFASPSVPSPGMLGKEASSSAGSGTREDGTFKGVREGSVDSSNRGRPSGSDAFEKEIIKIAEQEVYPLIGNIFNLLKPEYALFLAAPKALPLSKIKGASEVQRLSLDRYYVDRDNNQRQDIPFSRLYTKTISGVSSLMNRIIFNTQQEKNTFLSIAHSFESLQTHFDTLDAQLPGLGYDDADCFLAYDPLKRCQKDVPPSPFDAYIGKKVIYYDDHGSSGEWTSTIPAKQLPELSASLIISDSCLTNDYYHSPDGYVFGPEAIEKGALAYLGGVGTTVAIEGIIQQSGVGEDLFRLVVNEKSRDVGTSLMELYEKIKPESSDYILLGDPTYSPAIPKFSYPFIIKHSLSDTIVMGASFSFSVSDLKGPDEVGKIQVTASGKDGKVIKEFAPKCEIRGNAIYCEQIIDDPELAGEILFEIKAFDKANKNYGAVYKDVKITPIDIRIFTCDEGVMGEKTTCTFYIQVKKDNLGDVTLVKEEGGVINPPNPAVNCNRETSNNGYGCSLEFTPEETGDFKLKLTANTKSKDPSGKPFSNQETTTFRIKAIKVDYVNCLKPSALEKVDCKAFIVAKEDDLSKALIKKESGPGISPVEPVGVCSFGNDKKYECTFSFIPEKLGKYNLEFIAETKSVNPSDGKPYSDNRGFSLDFNPFELRDITCSHDVIGEEAKCSSEAYIKKDELGNAEFKITRGGKFEPDPLVTDCKWEESYYPFYYCKTKFKANDPGKYAVEFSVETKPDASGNSRSGKVEKEIDIKPMVVKIVRCYPLFGVESGCVVSIKTGKGNLGKVEGEVPGGAITIQNPFECEWDSYYSTYLCRPKFIPKKAGKFPFRVTASTVSLNSEGKPYTAGDSTEIDVPSISLSLKYFNPLLGKKEEFQVEVFIAQDMFDKVVIEEKGSPKFEIEKPEGDCSWLSDKYSCKFYITPKEVGSATLSVTAFAKKSGSLEPPSAKESLSSKIDAIRFSWHSCTNPLLGKKVECESTIRSSKTIFNNVRVEKVSGPNADISSPLADCDWSGDPSGNYVKCKFSFTPKEAGKLVIKLTASTKEIDGKPIEVVDERKFEVVSALISRFYCGDGVLNTNARCLATIGADKNAFKGATLEVVSGGEIEPVSPSGNCNWGGSKGEFTCDFTFVPKSMGKYKLKIVASLEGSSSPLEAADDINIVPINVGGISFSCERGYVGIPSRCSVDVIVGKDTFKGAGMEFSTQGAVEPEKPVGTCNYISNGGYDCIFQYTPKISGKFEASIKARGAVGHEEFYDSKKFPLSVEGTKISSAGCVKKSGVGASAKCSLIVKIKKDSFKRATLEKVSGGDIKMDSSEGACEWQDSGGYYCQFHFTPLEKGTYKMKMKVESDDSSSSAEGLETTHDVLVENLVLQYLACHTRAVGVPLFCDLSVLGNVDFVEKAIIEEKTGGNIVFSKQEGLCNKIIGMDGFFFCKFEGMAKKPGDSKVVATLFEKGSQNQGGLREELDVSFDWVQVLNYGCYDVGKVGQPGSCTISFYADDQHFSKPSFKKISGGIIEPENPSAECSEGDNKNYYCIFSLTPKEAGTYSFEIALQPAGVEIPPIVKVSTVEVKP